MTKLNLIFLIAGVLAIVYGGLIVRSAAVAKRDLQQDDWLRSDEVLHSKYHDLHYLRHVLDPDHKTISTGRSKGRGYAMVGIGIVLIGFALF
ncbi:MAG: hypothetical protein ACRETQ_08755 [Gammaproteobacteria bacterium]